MQRELFRAKHSYSDKYIISNSIKWELDMLYLLDRGTWKECEPTTRSVSYSNMVDKNNVPIFASLSEDGVGGDIVKSIYKDNIIAIWNGYPCFKMEYKKLTSKYDREFSELSSNEIKVIGIHKGIK